MEPTAAGVAPATTEPRGSEGAERADSQHEAERLAASIEELVELDQPGNLVRPDDEGAAPQGEVAFALSSAARDAISGATAATLRRRGIDLAEVPLDVAVARLTSEYRAVRPVIWPKPPIKTEPAASIPPPPAHALVRPAGVADLLVVKQQIKRYEAGVAEVFQLWVFLQNPMRSSYECFP